MRAIDPSGKNPTIYFAGVNIPVVYDTGQPRIIMRMVIEDLGLSPSGQLKDLKDLRDWADLKPLKVHARGGQYRKMTTATPETFMMWLNQIKCVSPAHQEQFDRYKSAIHNALRNFSVLAFPRKTAN